MAPKKTALSECIQKTLHFLEKEKVDFFLLGGVALSFLGEPRLTRDMDVDIFLTKDQAIGFLKKAKKAAFKFDEKTMSERIQTFGNFRMSYKKIPVDMILASTEFEKLALKRRKRVPFCGEKAYIPSPEDFILLKVIPGRPKDLVDIESVVLKYEGKLDVKYLQQWAQKISDEMENFRVWHQLQKLLKL